jgi:hypothetical protein
MAALLAGPEDTIVYSGKFMSTTRHRLRVTKGSDADKTRRDRKRGTRSRRHDETNPCEEEREHPVCETCQ